MSEEYKERFTKAIEHLREQLGTVRTNRANPALVEQIIVDCYGSKMPLVQIASISTPDPRQILIQPWDASLLKDVERAIAGSTLGVQPTLDGSTLRITLPALTEERRRELIKVVAQHEEAAKITIKKVREEVLKHWKEQEHSGEISEDIRARHEREFQKAMEECHTELDSLVEHKKTELMTI